MQFDHVMTYETKKKGEKERHINVLSILVERAPRIQMSTQRAVSHHLRTVSPLQLDLKKAVRNMETAQTTGK